MEKIVVIGLVGKSNFYKIDRFAKKGETVIADSFHVEYGGKGFNQALAASILGGDVTYITRMGDDDVRVKVKELSKKHNIKNYLLAFSSSTSAEASILTDKKGDNQVIVASGSNNTLTKEDIYSFEDEIKNAAYLLLQLELSDESLYAAMDIAFKYNVKVILNPAPYHKIKQEYLEKCFLLTPNEIEACELLGLDDISNLDNTLVKYNNLIITLGSNGVLLYINKNKIIIPCHKVKAVDTTGAGDTFNGALAYYLANGLSVEEAAKLANYAASISVGYPYVYEGITKIKE